MEESKYSYEGWTSEHKPYVIMAIELINKDINQLGTPYFFGDNMIFIRDDDSIVSNSDKFTLSFNGKIPESNNDNFILLVKTDTTEKKLYRLVKSIKYENGDTIGIIPIENYEHRWRNEYDIIADLNNLNYINAINNLNGVFPVNEQLNNRAEQDKQTVVEILDNIKNNENTNIIAASVAHIGKMEAEAKARKAEEEAEQAAAEKAEEEARKAEEAEKEAAEEADKAAAEEKARKAAADKAAAEEKARKAAADKARKAAEEKARKAAEEKARKAAEEQAKAAADAKAVADAKAQAEKEAKAKAAKEQAAKEQAAEAKASKEYRDEQRKILGAHLSEVQAYVAAETKRKAIRAETEREKIVREKREYAKKERELKKAHIEEAKIRNAAELKKKKDNVKNQNNKYVGGGSTAINLRNVIEELNQYARRVLMNSFYFKLSALTPDNINKLKDKIIDKEKNLTFNDLLLKPFMEFAYVQFDFERVKQSSLQGDLKHIIEVIMPSTEQKVDKNIIPIFIKSIEKDTTNYASITDPNEVSKDTMKKAIHIFRFIELINNSFKQNETDRNKNLQNFDSYALQKIIEHLYLIPNVYKLSQQKYNINIAIDGNTKSYDLQVYIDGLIDTQNRTNIITFLKINNTEPNNISMINKYNQRYQIKLDQVGIMDTNELKSTSMILGYRNDNFPYYKQIENTIKASPYIINNNQTEITLTNINNNENDVEIRSVNKYTNNYLFGKFQEIFPMYSGNTLITNEKISLQMSSITEQICEKQKPVFLLGYGTSGSGKTSSLIYFNNASTDNDKDGILVHLCKQIIKKKIKDNDIGSVKVTIQEYTSQGEEKERNYNFNNNLKYFKGDTYENQHEYHTKLATDNNFKITVNTTLGELLKQLVDVDRLVKATPNNPQSSRSHVLVFISFHNAMNNILGNLIVGDFAGKENKFQCNNIDVITDFLNKKITNSESTYQGKPFYSSQLELNEQSGGGDEETKINNEFDPYQKLEMNDNNQDKLDLLRTQEPLFDFVKPSNSIKKQNESEFKVDKYSSNILRYIFSVSEDLTSNSVIYERLLNKQDFKTSDSGINIIKTYKKYDNKANIPFNENANNNDTIQKLYNNKKALFLQHLIYADLFEGKIQDTDIINYNKLKEYNYKDVINNKDIQYKEFVPNDKNTTASKYQISTARLNLPDELNKIELLDKNMYGRFTDSSSASNIEFKNEIDEFNKINVLNQTTNSYKKPVDFTTDYIQEIVKQLSSTNTTEWQIYVNKQIIYNDPFDNIKYNRKKYIPVIKTFNINTMCEYFMTHRFKSLLPFFKTIKDINTKSKDPMFKSYIFYTELSKKHNYIDEFNYILDSLVKKTELIQYIDLMNTYNEKINETKTRLEYGKTICSNRVIEGKFINNSLEVIRKEIKKILNIKHKHSDALFNSPDYIDICLKSYCPTNQNCFEIKTETIDTDNTNTINLFDKIYEKLQNIPKYKDPNGKEEFYKDIVISIFGVFNVSRLTDNPPLHPYIDINDLKQIYYNKGDIHERELLPLLHNLKTFVEQDIDITNKTNTKLTEAIFYQKIKTLYDVGIRYHNNETGQIFNINKIEQHGTNDVQNLLKQMIEEIDIHNASSTIGTLEFLDQVSKFASVHNLCSNANPYLDNNDYNTYDSNMKNINTDN